MNQPLTVTPRRSRVRPMHLAPRRAAIPALCLLLGSCAGTVVLVTACGGSAGDTTADQAALVEQGRQTFRYETFGDEAKWTDALRMHEVISAAVDPVTALSVGLKVDAQALPAAVVDGIRNGSIDLTRPATTIALLKLDAVVGLKAEVETVNGQDALKRVGITCALCHSTVDDSFAPGIGKRLDGWPNRDLNPGAIIALSPALDAPTKQMFSSWGKGKFDPRQNIDGLSKPVVIPPAYGLEGIHSVTFTGDGSELAYWNRYVAVAEMGGLGTVVEPRLNLNLTNGTEDRVSSKLPALRAANWCSKDPAAARRATAARTSRTPTRACTRRAIRWQNPSRRATRRGPPRNSTVPRLSRVCGSTRRISTTGRRPP
jgi:hypothetical protein